MSAADKQPPLAALVAGGEAQTAAEPIGDGIFAVHDISNLYLVTTGDGDLLVNAGFTASAERNRALLAPHRTGPLRRIVLTQAHVDHFGGVPVLREAGTQVVAERRFERTWRFFDELHPYLSRRSGKLWAQGRSGTPPPSPEVVPDVLVDRALAFEQGGRRFEAISTSGGETLCGLTLWLPDDRIAFTGNLFGPMWRTVPFLVTIRGDKPRLVDRYLRSLERVRALEAETIVTSHGAPIRGAARVRADLDRMHGAVSYLREAVVAGMNAGASVHRLMRDVRLPDDLALGEGHGSVAWAVRSIWDEYSGWFLYEDGTTGLYPVPRASVDADLAELAGGAGRLAARARARLAAGEPLEALHLLDVALGAEPGDAGALAARRDALALLLERSGGANLSEVMWLRSEIAAVDAALVAEEA